MKYNLSKIMKRAWELVKKSGMTISSGLKKAWEEAKHVTAKKVFKGHLEMMAPEANNTVSINLWEKVNHVAHYMDGFAKMYIPTIDRFMEEYEF